MIVLPPNSLGPQCYSCRKRRVKCDSGVPNCTKCLKGGIDCPGYAKPIRWRVNTPASICNRTARLSRDRRAESSPLPLEESSETPSNVIRAKKQSDQMVIPKGLCFATKENLLNIESVEYFNNQILPDLAPSWPAFQREGILLQKWGEAPRVLHHVLMMFVLRHQQLRKGQNGEVRSEVYRYRGLVISELNRFLQNSLERSSHIALVAVLMMLQAEIQLAAVGQWKIHLAGARQLIALHGGMKTCIESLPYEFVVPMISDMMLVDVMSSSTTSAGRLSREDLDAHVDYLGLIGVLEAETLASWCPCPVPVFREIIQINRLRILDGLPNLVESYTGASWATTRASLLQFDALSWADDLLKRAAASPIRGFSLMETKAEWVWLGQSYQAASFLYLLRTCPTRSGQSGFDGDSQILISHFKSQLDMALRHLFSPFSVDPFGTDGPRLWRFCMWPLFIDAYDTVLWGEHASLTPRIESINAKIQRFRSVGVRLGTSTMDDAADLLCNQLKSQNPGTVKSWDDGFPDYSIFVF